MTAKTMPVSLETQIKCVALKPTKKNQIWSHYRFEALTVLQCLRKLQTVKVIQAGMKMSKSMLGDGYS
jgi:hypothetical protein